MRSINNLLVVAADSTSINTGWKGYVVRNLAEKNALILKFVPPSFE